MEATHYLNMKTTKKVNFNLLSDCMKHKANFTQKEREKEKKPEQTRN